MAYFIQDNCVACLKCVVECPKGAIHLTTDRPEIDAETCVSCGLCARICKESAPIDLKAPPAAPVPHARLEKRCDLVVLGGGGSGLVAAARAAWLTHQKVIVVEKEQKLGGGAWYAADFKVFNSRWQKERGIPDVLEQSVQKAMDDTYWRLNPRLVRRCFEATGEFFDWLCDTGEQVEEQFREGIYIFDGPNGPRVPVFKKMRRGRQGGTGKFVVDQMESLCRSLGVEFLTGCAAEHLEQENGLVTGVLARDAGGEVHISCRACVLATGSWINNQKLLERVDPLFAAMKPVRSAHRSSAYTGDGLLLAQEAGAKLDYASLCLRLMGPVLLAADNSELATLNAMLFDPAPIYVNARGVRWINEHYGSRGSSFFNTAIPLREQPEGISYVLFDAACVEDALRRSRQNEQPVGPFGGARIPDNWEEELERAVQTYPFAVYRANTLLELAEQTGLNPAALEETVARYNESCEAGYDRDFCKDHGLVPLRKAPFYAIRCTMATDGAFGGVPVEEHSLACREDGSVIENLCVTGDFASGRFINQGGIKVQIINDLAWAFASGYIAGETLGTRLSKK